MYPFCSTTTEKNCVNRGNKGAVTKMHKFLVGLPLWIVNEQQSSMMMLYEARLGKYQRYYTE